MMTSSPSPSGCGSSQSSLKDIRTLDDVKDIQPDKQHPTWVTPKERSENAAQLRVLTAALKPDSAFSLHTPDLQVASSSANVVPPSCNTQPERQLQTQQAYNQSPSRKRKYQVTMMADSPLKLRVSWGGAPPCGLDGTVDNPSPWDALAGEDASSSDDEPVADRRAAAPSVQQAGQSAQAATTTPSTNEARFPVLRPGDEIWTVWPPPSLLCPSLMRAFYRRSSHVLSFQTPMAPWPTYSSVSSKPVFISLVRTTDSTSCESNLPLYIHTAH